MDRFIEGFLIGRMSAGKPNGCGFMALIGFGLFLILFLWNVVHLLTVRPHADQYKHQQHEIQLKETHTQK
jgi:hypothetical protein